MSGIKSKLIKHRKVKEVRYLVKNKIIAIMLLLITIISFSTLYVNAESDVIVIDTYNLILTKLDEDTLEPIRTHASYEIAIEGGQKINASTDENGQIKITNIKLPKVAGVYQYSIEEIKAPSRYEKEETVGILEVTFEKRPDGSELIMGDDGQMYYTSELIITKAEIKSGNHIWVPKKGDMNGKEENGWTEDTVNVYATNKSSPLYLESDVYEIGYHIYPQDAEDNQNHIDYDFAYQKGDTYIRKIIKYDEAGKPVIGSRTGNIEITIEEFKKHLITNAEEIIILDKEGNQIINEQTYLRTGMTLKLRRIKEEIELSLIVYGDTGKYVDAKGRARWSFMNIELQKCKSDKYYYRELSEFEKETYDLSFSGTFGVGKTVSIQRRPIVLADSIVQLILSKPGVTLDDLALDW